ncbi:GAF domain-containing protein [Blastococcus sp. TML/M2B]|uniref:sensor histidine kinase n=1 Tax=unclassified Blastococcus TaxID=2619396 RepID=UPI00190BFED5|nr:MULTISPECIES: GAF domain-containing protein [unclassified Blastococcus]MBN1094224.1 GAF domain-containing protein [Blastococcus sp. TML/M2B]MBN1095655.1 GAF domain-containing protein [Blastococcus sp. TML/C7B]
MSDPPHDAPELAVAVRAAASGGHLETTLREVLRAAVRQVDATYGALGVLSPGGERLDRFVVEGLDEETQRRIGAPRRGEGLLGLLLAEPVALRLDDLADHPAFQGFPDGHPPMRSFVGVPVCVGDAVLGNLHLAEKRSGGPFTDADAEMTRSPAAVAGLAIENACLLERAELRRAWAQAGVDFAATVLAGAVPDDVLRTGAARISELSGADAIGVLVPEPNAPGDMRVIAAVGRRGPDSEGMCVPVQGGVLGEVRTTGAVRALPDVGDAQLTSVVPEVAGEFSGEYGPALFIPVGGPPALGILAMMRERHREPFDPELLTLAGEFAAQATVAMELVRSQRRERRLQVQADRDRIARDLHDHVVQRIFATALALDRIGRSVEADSPELAARLAERVDELDGTISRIRSSIFELQHQDASPDGVRHRLVDVVRSVVDGHGLRPDLRMHGEVEDLPAGLVHDVVAAVRELVTNVVRHARAQRVTVTVTVTDEVRVQVADDGRGLPEVTVRSGLANLADRAERRGGRLTTSAGPSGSEVRWTVPLAGGTA